MSRAPAYDPPRSHPPVCDISTDQSVLERLNAVRIIVILFIGIGYSSTIAVGPHTKEWLNSFGYDPSLFGIQVLFFLSGWLAWRSLEQGRTGLTFLASRAQRTMPWVALYTFVVVALLYPTLCNYDAPFVQSPIHLLIYFIKTVFFIDPGGPMPGALDNALYACILQGTVWTLRWGMIAYFGLLVLHSIGLRRRSHWLTLFILVLLGHLSVSWWTLKTGSTLLEPIIPGLRLSYPFLLGILVYQAKDLLPTHGRAWLALAAGFIGLAAVNYYTLPWTHLIEVFATIGWCALAMAALQSGLTPLAHWPNVALPAYLGIWPIMQTLLALNPDMTVAAIVVITMTLVFALALTLYSVSKLVRGRVHRRIQAA